MLQTAYNLVQNNLCSVPSTFSLLYTTVLALFIWALRILASTCAMWHVDDKNTTTEPPQHEGEEEAVLAHSDKDHALRMAV